MKHFVLSGLLCLFSAAILLAKDQLEYCGPYFRIADEALVTQFPLLHTEANVSIAGVIAEVEVTQVYTNQNHVPIEAVYVFPSSTDAAIHAMKMTIGERTIQAKIERKDKAKKDYEQAKKDGKAASLLEQKRPNVFEMRVANIMPSDTVKVEFSYTETVKPENGTYEWVYPTVVGPRYEGETVAAGAEPWVSNPYLASGTAPLNTFDVSVQLEAGLPIQKAQVNSHKTRIQYNGPTTALIDLDASESGGGNRDFILQYQLKGRQIESGLMVYEGEEHNYFMLMLQPPKKVDVEMIPPREYVFIVDVSGSMSGFPLATSKALMKDLLKELRPSDLFNILFFASGSNMIFPESQAATAQNIQTAFERMNGQRGGGGTNLLAALNQALDLPTNENYTRSFVIATDGYVSVEKKAFDLIRSSLNEANFFSFGIGRSVNRFLIEGLARAGHGESFVVIDENVAPAKASLFRKYISKPVLSQIEIEANGIEICEMTPSSIPSLFAEKPLMVYGKFQGELSKQSSLRIKGLTGTEKYERSIAFTDFKAGCEHDLKALKYLWARDRIKTLGDYRQVAPSSEIAEEITQLGLSYGLMTDFTSFIAVDSETRNNTGHLVSISQPLPMPRGVTMGGVSSTAYYSKRNNTGVMSLEVVTEEAEVIDDAEICSGADYDENGVEIYVVVEKMPEFPGGEQAMKEFIKVNLRYPALAKKNLIEGLCVVSFVIEENGSISNVKVTRDIGGGCGQEAVRLIRLMPKWSPGEQRGKKVKVKYNLPVRFQL